jgi:formamidopyrimidine-DNA glycosylase
LPELPDVVLYIEALKARIVGERLERLHLLSPFVLRSVDPPIESIVGLTVRDVLRSG